MLPIDSGDLRGIICGSFLKSVYEKSTRLGASFSEKLNNINPPCSSKRRGERIQHDTTDFNY